MIEDILHHFPGRVKGDQIQIKVCPFCNNPKYNLEISTTKKLYHCWCCNASGTLSGFCKKFSIPLEDYNLSTASPQKNHQENEEICLPESFTIINPNKTQSLHEKNAVDYLNFRGISNETIIKFNIGFCYKGNFECRIIFPIFEDKELVYFTSRGYWYKEKEGALHPKYPKKLVLYNFNRFQKNVVLTEGPLDVLSVFQVGYSPVGLLGKKIYPEQVNKILSSRIENIKILLDSDTSIKEKMDIFYKLNVPGIKIDIMELPEGDPNSYGQGKLKELLDNN